MKAQAIFKSVHWMLLAVIALAPAAVFAQQDNASQDKNQKQTEAAPAKTEAAKGETEKTPAQTEAAAKPSEESQAKTDEEGKLISVQGSKALGMSILGNQEAPKALVIVPWKSSELGNTMGISTMLDDSRQPVDKEVFMRMLSYYEIRSGVAPIEKNAQPEAAVQRRKQ